MEKVRVAIHRGYSLFQIMISPADTLMYSKLSLFWIQLTVQVLLIALVYWFPFDTGFQAILCGILLCVVAIPHGSNDHLYRPDKSTAGMIKFLGIYLGTILFYLGLWYTASVLAFILFFVMSFHHFGQSNFENDSIKYLPSWLWGIWILAFPVLIHMKEAVGIFELMLSSNDDPISGSFLTQIPIIDFKWRFVVMIVLGILYLSSILKYERQNFFRYAAQFIVITLWYLFTPLLFGSIIVFCLWHSLQSMRHQAMYFTQLIGGTFRDFLKSMIPFSLVAIISFSAYIYFKGFQIEEAFILLSVVSLPHLVVMHRLYHETNERASNEGSFVKTIKLNATGLD